MTTTRKELVSIKMKGAWETGHLRYSAKIPVSLAAEILMYLGKNEKFVKYPKQQRDILGRFTGRGAK